MEDYDNIPIVLQPTNLRKTLFKHQLASIYKMETLEREQFVEYANGIKETKIGINADFTGFGKTLSMIGLISRDKMEWNMDAPFVKETITTESGGLIRNRHNNRYDRLPTTLILVSSSIVSHWFQELSLTNLKVGIVDNVHSVDNIKAENYDVLIVTVGMYNNLMIAYNKYVWKRFIFDEPGHIRVVGMKEIHAGFYWFVTATPNVITALHKNCRNSFIKKIIGDGSVKFEEEFKCFILKNDIGFVKASFDMPPTTHYYHKCVQPILKVVSGIVNHTIHNMIAAGNIEGAIAALGGKKTTNIVELVKQEKQEKLANIQMDIKIYSTIRIDPIKLKIATEKSIEIQKQIEELDSRFDLMLQDSCSICTEKILKPVLEPHCQNIFCGECLLTWLHSHKSCPLCRASIEPAELVYISNKICGECNIEPIKEIINFTPTQKVIDIIKSTENGKFIIFSEYNSTFELICRLLDTNKISFTLVKGSWQTRQGSIDSFKNGDIQVIFLNSKFNAAGINLQESTDIILYHTMDLSTQQQIIGRANRIGRTKPLNVHHILVDI